MTKASDFFAAGGKPKRTVTYTSGTGTFTPLEANSWCRVTLVGGGSAGGAHTAQCSAGGSGAEHLVAWLRVTGATAYSVGAGGPAVGVGGNFSGVDGGSSIFGRLTAAGGVGGASAAMPSAVGGGAIFQVNGGEYYSWKAGSTAGGAGAGASSVFRVGGVPGVWRMSDGVATTQPGGGGSSVMGAGGASAGASGTGYGAGGAGAQPNTLSGAGSGGIIIIEEFGAW